MRDVERRPVLGEAVVGQRHVDRADARPLCAKAQTVLDRRRRTDRRVAVVHTDVVQVGDLVAVAFDRGVQTAASHASVVEHADD
jgi:hypothetical protein